MLLLNQTRVLVTHGITCLPKVDLIITMKDGAVSEVGTYEELLHAGGAFADFIETYLNDSEKITSDETENSKHLKDIYIILKI